MNDRASEGSPGSGEPAPTRAHVRPATTADGSGTVTISVELGRQRAIVDLGGIVDASSSQLVGSMMERIVEDGVVDLVLNLGALDHIDQAVVQVVVDLAARVAEHHGELTVRAPGDTLQLLGHTGVGATVQFELGTRHVTPLGTEQRDGDGSVPVAEHPPPAARLVSRLSSKLNHDAIDAAFHRVTVLATAMISGAHGASVTIERNGRLITAASSNATIMQMDKHQYDTGEGPCLAAVSDGRWFHVPSLRHDGRWPAFGPRAVRDGIASILSTPIKLEERSVGALNIYSTVDGIFGRRQQEEAALLASHAAGVLADIGADEEADERTRQALQSRATIALAQGIIVERARLTTGQALATLLRSARESSTPVADHARGIIDSTASAISQEAAGADR